MRGAALEAAIRIWDDVPGGETMFEGFDIIHTYTRAQCIADGGLVDLRQGELEQLVVDAGIRVPIACTAAVFAQCIELTPAAVKACNDIKGRLWDVLWMFKCAARGAAGGGDTLYFELYVVRDRVRPTKTKLKAVIGPGDDGEPCITVLFPEED